MTALPAVTGFLQTSSSSPTGPKEAIGTCAQQRGVVQRIFHRGWARCEPPRPGTDAHPRFGGPWRPASTAFGRVRRARRHKCPPWNHAVHFIEKRSLAPSLRRQTRTGSLHGRHSPRTRGFGQAHASAVQGCLPVAARTKRLDRPRGQMSGMPTSRRAGIEGCGAAGSGHRHDLGQVRVNRADST